MKKHDEGYVLAFVMVVITVLCLIAVLLMPLSLRNLEAQNDSIRRMQDKYAAQGVIETVVAKMDSVIKISMTEDSASLLKAYLGAGLEGNAEITYNSFPKEIGTGNFVAEMDIVSTNDSARVEATLIWEASVVGNTETNTYQITPYLLQYKSYQVSSVREEGPDD